MDGGAPSSSVPVRREFGLPGRGPGRMAGLEWGRANRPYDLVFLHANGFNALTYRRILSPLGDRYRVLAIDQRGHGASSLSTITHGRTDWLDFRDDLLALLEVLDLTDAVLAGHSMGGTTSMMAAAEAPARARGLILFDPVLLPLSAAVEAARPGAAHADLLRGALRRRNAFPSRAAAAQAYRGRGAFATWPPDMLADYVTGGFIDSAAGGVVLACAPEWEASTFASHAHAAAAREALHRIACPAEILLAEKDTTCRIDDEIETLTRTGRITIQTVPGTTHFLPMERPDLATTVLARALELGASGRNRSGG